MTRRFVIGVDSLDADQEKKVREYLAKYGGWWHWIDNLWLLATDEVEISASDIRDKLTDISANAKIVVFEFPEDITWAASSAKNKKGRRIYDWLKDTWAD